MAKLILIPGVGATRVLFEAQRHHFDQDLFVPDWQAPISTQIEGKKKPVPETLRDYARRWADRWVQTVLANRPAKEPYWIGGVSVGGMICLEAARRLHEEGKPPEGVFLISSCRTSGAMPVSFKMQAMVMNLLSDALVTKMLGRTLEKLGRKESLSDLDLQLLKRMVQGIDPKLVKWCRKASAAWKFSDDDARALARSGVAIHQIHGEKDSLLPLHRGHPDKVIHGGGHLINLSHAEAVNEYIASRMKDDVGREDE